MENKLGLSNFRETENETKIFQFPINTGKVENTSRPAVYNQIFNIPDGYAIKDFKFEENSKVGEVKGPILNFYNEGSFLVSEQEIFDEQNELFDFLASVKATVPVKGVPVPVEQELKTKIQDEFESFSSRRNQYVSSDNTIEIEVEARAVKDALGLFYKSGGNYEGTGYLEIEPVEGTSEDLSDLVEDLKIEIQETFANSQGGNNEQPPFEFPEIPPLPNPTPSEPPSIDRDPITGSPVARYWDNIAGSHFFTADPLEQQSTNSNSVKFKNEGFEFLSGGDITLQRYVNTEGGYFYASNPGQVNFVETLQEWSASPSGEPIRVYSSQQLGTLPVTRFYNLDTDGHFYTISPGDVAHANTLPNFRNEGVAFYAMPTNAL